MGLKRVKLPGFNGALWLCGVAIVVWLLAVPPLQNLRASRTWRQVPCHLDPLQTDPPKFLYEVDGAMYVSTRENFWQATYLSEKRPRVVGLENNGQCWVNPAHAQGAVLRLDATTNWSGAAGRLAISAFVLVAIGILTFLSPKRKPQPVPTARHGNEAAP